MKNAFGFSADFKKTRSLDPPMIKKSRTPQIIRPLIHSIHSIVLACTAVLMSLFLHSPPRHSPYLSRSLIKTFQFIIRLQIAGQ